MLFTDYRKLKSSVLGVAFWSGKGGGGCYAHTSNVPIRYDMEISLTLLRFILSTRCKGMKSVIGLFLCVLWRRADDCSHVSTFDFSTLELGLFVLCFVVFVCVCVCVCVCF